MMSKTKIAASIPAGLRELFEAEIDTPVTAGTSRKPVRSTTTTQNRTVGIRIGKATKLKDDVTRQVDIEKVIQVAPKAELKTALKGTAKAIPKRSIRKETPKVTKS